MDVEELERLLEHAFDFLDKLEQAVDFRDNYEAKVRKAADYITTRVGTWLDDFKHRPPPVFGIVLGSGLGDLADSIEGIASSEPIVIPYDEIPNFPKTTVPGHEGKLIIGELQGVPVIGLKGRKHYYEVADEPFNNGILQVALPVHVLAELGVKNYFATNAAGGLNPDYSVGDIMVIRSHINLIPNALLGRHHDFSRVDMDASVNSGNSDTNSRVWRFQPMNGAYDPLLRGLLVQAGEKYKEHIHSGVYLAVTGPTYETEGECIEFRDGLKADAVGMSTTPEVIVARNRGMRAVGMSCITNVIAPDGTNATNHEEVKAILESAEVKDRLSSTVREFFRLYRESYLQ